MRNFVITVDGKSYSVGVEEVGESTDTVLSQTPAATIEKKEVKTDVSATGKKVLSPFPGMIKNILVSNGDSVKENQPIIVLEAMKMDNEITAPCAGKVTINVSKGANVETNALLAIIG